MGAERKSRKGRIEGGKKRRKTMKLNVRGRQLKDRINETGRMHGDEEKRRGR